MLVASSKDYKVCFRGHSEFVRVVPLLSTPEKVHDTAVWVADPGEVASALIVNSMSGKGEHSIVL